MSSRTMISWGVAGVLGLGVGMVAWQGPAGFPSSTTYALAYSSGRHFAVTGDVLHLIYADGAAKGTVHLWDAATTNGRRWTHRRLPAAPRTYAVVSTWAEEDDLFVATASHRNRQLTLVEPEGATRLFRRPGAWTVEAPNGTS